MGHALWYPGSNDRLAQQSYKETGVRLGDLGVIRRNGTFDFLWNLAASKDDPVNLHNPPKPVLSLPDGDLLAVKTMRLWIEVARQITSVNPSDCVSSADTTKQLIGE